MGLPLTHLVAGLTLLRLRVVLELMLSWSRSIVIVWGLWICCAWPGNAAGLPEARRYLEQECKQYDKEHGFLVDHWLRSLLLESSSVSAEDMLSPASVPRLPSWFVAHKTGLPRLPFVFVVNNELRLHPSLEGMEAITPGKDQLNTIGMAGEYIVPIIRELLTMMKLPNMVLAVNAFDEPMLAHLGSSWPFFGFCNVEQRENSALMPANLKSAVFAGNRSHCRAGPGDPRKPQALWLGTDSGWGNGRRRAVLLASRKYPELLMAGITKKNNYLVSQTESRLIDSFMHEPLPYTEQIDKHQAIVYADGCPGATIPLMYEPTLYPREQGVNFIQMWSWVRQHPEQVRSVVQESTLFAERHLSRQGKTCYSVRLLLAYAENIADAERIEALFKKADGIYGTA
eukprot:jgi/Astpho2/358/Aster-x0918